jgi:hypothetical protein
VRVVFTSVCERTAPLALTKARRAIQAEKNIHMEKGTCGLWLVWPTFWTHCWTDQVAGYLLRTVAGQWYLPRHI